MNPTLSATWCNSVKFCLSRVSILMASNKTWGNSAKASLEQVGSRKRQIIQRKDMLTGWHDFADPL